MLNVLLYVFWEILLDGYWAKTVVTNLKIISGITDVDFLFSFVRFKLFRQIIVNISQTKAAGNDKMICDARN